MPGPCERDSPPGRDTGLRTFPDGQRQRPRQAYALPPAHGGPRGPTRCSSPGEAIMIAMLVTLFLIVALVGYLIGVYNSLVRVRAAVKLAWSDIDVLLVQRHDELPKLVEVCKQYMQYEGGTLERVMRARAGVDAARNSGSMSALGAAERELRSGLGGLYAVAENYPQLKASEPFHHLQE